MKYIKSDMNTAGTNKVARTLRHTLAAVLAVSVVASTAISPASATSRIKDIADFEGIRDNLLVGYGLVVGLNGTGDGLRNAPFTKQSLEAMLERLGVNTRGTTLNTKNVAAVMISASLPAFTKQGTRIDITASTLGDSSSLLGGTLLATPLLGADGEVYAVAQGALAVGGFTAQGEGGSVTKGVPTSGRIPAGAIIEREVPFDFAGMTRMNISLRNPDLTTALRVSEVINAFLGHRATKPQNPATIELIVPPAHHKNLVALLTKIEQLNVEPDQSAKVVVDEQTGIIVMGDKVRVSTVAIAQGNLTISVTESEQVSSQALSPRPAILKKSPAPTLVQKLKVMKN